MKKGKIVLLTAMMFCICLITVFSIRQQAAVTPQNPIHEMEETMRQNQNLELISYLALTPELSEELDTGEEPSEEATDAGDAEEGAAAGEESGAADDSTGGEIGTEAGENGRGGDGMRDAEDGKEKNYFTTSILDGETVTSPKYSFTITQLQKQIPLKEEIVLVNGESVGQFNGKVVLKEGKNAIKVTCTYQNEGEKEIHKSRSYTVYLTTSEIIFYTNLLDGENVKRQAYEFIAYAEYRGERLPIGVSLDTGSCNKKEGKEDTYTALLKAGENVITLSAETQSGVKGNVSYRVNWEIEGATIITDLASIEVSEPEFHFYASAMLGSSETEQAVLVTMNGKELAAEDFHYQVTLEEGQNIFHIDATAADASLPVQTYVVSYYPPPKGLTIRTDLEDEEVSDSSFTFFAYARDTAELVPLKITVNGTDLTETENHYYTVGLKKNDNDIVLTAENGQETKTLEFTITYVPEDGSEPLEPDEDTKEEENPYLPVVKTDLTDGSDVKGGIRNVTVWAYDYHQKKLSAGYLTVKLNGSAKGVSLIWDDSIKTSYRFKLREGKNEITIKAVDEEGNKATYLWTVNCTKGKDGEPIGQATFSLEADTLGLGYLVAPTKVDIYEGENAAYVLDRFLKEHGYSYQSTGSLSTGFYLAHIGKRGLLKDLPQKIIDKYGKDSYNVNSLGEFDFCHKSGWMYSVDGVYPNYGFADCYLNDGAELRIRFTLSYGTDIGGEDALGAK